MSRAYTSFLAEIKSLPVFSTVGEVRPYDGAEVEPLAFYLVRVPVLDGVLFPLRNDFVPGETVSLVATGPVGADPLLIQVGYTRFALRRGEADRVKVLPS